MDDRLEPIDRATLVSWRAMNVLGWTALAVVVAIVMHTTIVQLVVRTVASPNLNERPDSLVSTAGFLAPRFALKAAIAALIGLAIGGIIGAKVWTAQPIVAATAALGYDLISVFFLEYTIHPEMLQQGGGISAGVAFPQHGLGGSGWSALGYDLIGIVTVLIAALWARRIARHNL